MVSNLRYFTGGIGITMQSVWGILKNKKYKLFKTNIVQVLGKSDKNRWLEFCETVLGNKMSFSFLENWTLDTVVISLIIIFISWDKDLILFFYFIKFSH